MGKMVNAGSASRFLEMPRRTLSDKTRRGEIPGHRYGGEGWYQYHPHELEMIKARLSGVITGLGYMIKSPFGGSQVTQIGGSLLISSQGTIKGALPNQLPGTADDRSVTLLG